jgi:hypothetical protein
MASPQRRGRPVCLALDGEALRLLRQMTNGHRTMGRLVSGLILAEAARREARYAERERYAAALAAINE